jgi:hypothetical protein
MSISAWFPLIFFAAIAFLLIRSNLKMGLSFFAFYFGLAALMWMLLSGDPWSIWNFLAYQIRIIKCDLAGSMC